MPHFTSPIDNAGPLLNVHLTVSEARRSALQSRGLEVPKPFRARGLLDTGASATCVDHSVPRALGLTTPTGEASMLTPSTQDGPVPANQYDCGLIIFATFNENPYFVRNLAVTEASLFERQGFHALIGRDVLANCVLIYNGTIEHYTLAF